MQPQEFRAEARRRRNHFFLTWIGWLVVGFPLWGIYSLILPSDDPMVPGTAALFTWGAFWWWVMSRVKKLRCFRCGRPAFPRPFFFMRHAKCELRSVLRAVGVVVT